MLAEKFMVVWPLEFNVTFFQSIYFTQTHNETFNVMVVFVGSTRDRVLIIYIIIC